MFTDDARLVVDYVVCTTLRLFLQLCGWMPQCLSSPIALHMLLFTLSLPMYTPDVHRELHACMGIHCIHIQCALTSPDSKCTFLRVWILQSHSQTISPHIQAGLIATTLQNSSVYQ